MTNEIRTRRLIVTLPDTAAEEIAEIASSIEEIVRDGNSFYPKPEATVEVARDEYVPVADGLYLIAEDHVDGSTDRATLMYRGQGSISTAMCLFPKADAAQIGAQFLRAADELTEEN